MNTLVQPSPFVGLRPYDTDDSMLFFGRQEQVAELMRRLDDGRFLAVVGSSGCGKSSLVRAGLIPLLRAGFVVADRDKWLIVSMKPGDEPLENLAASVLDCLEGAGHGAAHRGAADLARSIREEGAAAVLDALASTMTEQDTGVLLLVDQFEELFRLTGNAAGPRHDDAADFVSILIDLAEQREVAIYTVITMRSDFLGDCDRFAGLPEALNRGQYLVPRLTREQRRDAIQGPVSLYGQTITDRLTDRLLNETIDTRDDLPVLQHALLRTWECWRDDGQGPIDVSHYASAGTIHQALSRDAEGALEGMSERELLLTKGLFQALTTVDSTNRGIRRPAKLDTIAAQTEAKPEEIWAIVERFRSGGRSFLVASSNDPDANPTIDISHESLIRQWTTLGTWVAEELESVRIYRRLAESARLYRAGKADLYSDQNLQIALDWFEAERPNEVWAPDSREDFEGAIKFLERSKAERDKTLAEKEFQRRWAWVRGGIAMFVLMVFLSSFAIPGVTSFWDGLENIFNGFFQEGAAFQEGSALADSSLAAEAPSFARASAEFVKLMAHVLLFFALTGFVKRPYRRLVFGPIRDRISAHSRPPPASYTLSSMLKRLKRTAPRVIERLAKWICVLVGCGILGTCSYVGVANGGSGGIGFAIGGVIVAAALVGWVFAVARLNSEIAVLRARTPEPPPDSKVGG